MYKQRPRQKEMKETENKFQIETEAIQETVQQELFERRTIAIALGLLPKCIKEFEFTVYGKNATAIQFWPSYTREQSESITVSIPKEHQSKFKFPCAAELHSRRLKNILILG